MDSLTESEITQIARQEREDGIHRLSSHFSWPDFCDERQNFHQEFVYDVTMYAVACGFPWLDVIQTASMAKSLFPQLEGLDTTKLLSLLSGALSEGLLHVTPVQRFEFTHFLMNTLITRQRLLQAVVEGAVDLSIAHLDLEVELPPTLCPLFQGTDLEEWERQHHQAKLESELQLKEEELRMLRDQPRVSLKDVSVPHNKKNKKLNKEEVVAVVRSAVRSTEDQMLDSLTKEASILRDIQELKLQLENLTTGGRHSPVPANSGGVGSAREATSKKSQQKSKSKTRVKESGNAA